MKWEWIPLPEDGAGEYRLHCPGCDAENFLLKRADPGA
jgi:hypothetical protein